MIDTNVIIDVYQNRDDFVKNSSKVLRLSETNKITGLITASTITDIYFILGRHIKDREA
jgi:predicted nucleic acid-binding protein